MSYYTNNNKSKSNGLERRSWETVLMRNMKCSNTYRHKKYIMDVDSDFLRQLLEEQEGKCYWLGISLNIEKHNKNDFFNPSVDRLDNSKGYVRGNVVLCSRMANYARNKLSVEEFQKHLEVLKNSFKVK